MKQKTTSILYLVLFCWGHLLAQNTSDFPTEKVERSSDLGNIVSLLHSPSEENLWSLQLRTYSNADFGNPVLGAFGQLDFRLSYSHQFSEVWTGGASFLFAERGNSSRFAPEVWLSNQTRLFEKIHWTKRIQLRYLNLLDQTNSTSPFLQGNFQTSLGIQHEFKESALTGLLAFNANRNFEDTPGLRRNISDSFWRSNVFWTPREDLPIAVGLWAQRQTRYFFALAMFAENENGMLVQTAPDRRLNIIQWTFGAQVVIWLGKSQKSPSVSQLANLQIRGI